MPVETSAFRLSGLRTTPRTMVRTSISPFGLIALCASSGSARWAGSLMTRSAAKGKTRLGGVGGGDMAFHVDGGCSRFGVQRGLAGARGNHPLDTVEPAAHHAAAAARQAAALERRARDHLLVQRHIGKEPGIAGHDFGRHYHVAGLQRRIEAAGHAKRDHAAEGG
jgi:hypothetical protein